MFNVMIVEKDSMTRKLLEYYIQNSKNYKLVAVIDSVNKIKSHYVLNKVDLIIMDISVAMEISGFEIAQNIKKQLPNVKIILITNLPEYSFIRKSKVIGIDSFWYKNGDEEKLLNIMDSTMDGQSIYPDDTPIVKLGAANSSDFTERELDVLRELVAGKTDADIAAKLCISVITVKQHIQKIREKTKFRNRTELAVNAVECGLVINEKDKTIL